MLIRCLARLRHRVRHCVDTVRSRVSRWTQPHPIALPLGVVADVARSRRDLLLENALLRQQVLILNRSVKRPALTPVLAGERIRPDLLALTRHECQAGVGDALTSRHNPARLARHPAPFQHEPTEHLGRRHE